MKKKNCVSFLFAYYLAYFENIPRVRPSLLNSVGLVIMCADRDVTRIVFVDSIKRKGEKQRGRKH